MDHVEERDPDILKPQVWRYAPFPRWGSGAFLRSGESKTRP
jgi:hypothetical protein